MIVKKMITGLVMGLAISFLCMIGTVYAGSAPDALLMHLIEQERRQLEIKRQQQMQIEETQQMPMPVATPAAPQAVPQKVPAIQPIIQQHPLVSVSAFNRRLGDVLFELAGSVNYAVVFGPQTDPNIPVVINVKDVPLDRAIDIITSFVNYGYEIDNKTITVSRHVVRTFSVPKIAINVPTMAAELGGDMLGGGGGGGGGGGMLGGGGGDFGTQNLRASVSLEKVSEKADGRQMFENNIRRLLSATGHYVLDWLSATIMVYDSPRNIKLIEQYINTLRMSSDKLLFVEATITQVATRDDLEFGIDWNVVARRISGEILTDPAREKRLQIETAVTNIPSPAITIARTARDVSAVLRALREQGDVRILSSPYIYVRNLQPVAIYSGRSVPFISGIQRTTTGMTAEATTSFTISRAQDGVMLSIKAHVRDDGKIDLQITPILSSIDEFVAFTIDGNTFENPVSSIQQTLQSVTVNDGETIIIGGIKRNRTEEVVRGVPVLGDLPMLGNLFRSTSDKKSSSELVIAIRVKRVDI